MIYVLVPGAWAGSWAWDDVADRLRDSGHTVHQLTLPGLGDGLDDGEGGDKRAIRLSTHVGAVMDYLASRALQDVVLVGHSYSGLVVGQVAVKCPQRVRHGVFVEAFLPVHGASLLEVSGLDVAYEKQAISENGGLWPAPTLEELRHQPYLTEEQVNLLATKQQSHPGSTVTDPAEMAGPLSELSATFVSSKGWLSTSGEADLVAALRGNDSWHFKEIEGGHWPMLSRPEALSVLLQQVAIR